MKGTPSRSFHNVLAPVAVSLLLGGCLTDKGSFTGNKGESTSDANSPPSISGTPPRRVDMGQSYSFAPTASDPDGDRLSFTISERPRWLSFDESTGRLSGTPSLADVGMHNAISISVSDGSSSTKLGPFSIEVESDESDSNSAPSISGSPASEVTAGNAYAFTPTASDPDGDVLTFSVSGLPDWASFNESNGALSGTPGDADIGTYSNITIAVSDGGPNVSLQPFSITVQAISLGSVTLNWNAPTENEDGSTLTDLAGYRIYWGTDPGSYTNSVTIDNPSVTTYVVDNLSAGQYEFVATSFNVSGVESRYSDPATKVVQ